MERFSHACHICDEAMEADVVAAQGDTCERCYLAHVIPAAQAARLDDGFPTIEGAVQALLERLDECADGGAVERLFVIGALKVRIANMEQPALPLPTACFECGAALSRSVARRNGNACDECSERGWSLGRVHLAMQ